MTESVSSSRLESSGEPMCEKCVELEQKIERYQRFTLLVDTLTTSRIQALINDLKRIRDSMHPPGQSRA